MLRQIQEVLRISAGRSEYFTPTTFYKLIYCRLWQLVQSGCYQFTSDWIVGTEWSVDYVYFILTPVEVRFHLRIVEIDVRRGSFYIEHYTFDFTAPADLATTPCRSHTLLVRDLAKLVCNHACYYELYEFHATVRLDWLQKSIF